MGTVKYRKVLDLLRDDILAGKYSLRSKFPSVAMIIRRFGISYLTAVKVVEMLKDEGLVRSYQGRGTFVTRIASKCLTVLLMSWFTILRPTS